MKKGIVAAALAATLAAFSLACSETGGVDLNPGTRCDYLVIPSIQTNAEYRTWTERDCLVRLSVPVSVLVDYLAQGGAGPVEPGTQLSSFVIDKYVVSYRNITQNGERVARVDVPDTFLVTTAGHVGAGGNFPATFTLEGATILQLSAKGQPPLNDDAFYFDRTNPLAGVQLEAEMVFWGHPVGQPSRECRGTMIFRFTIFDEDDPAAEAAICATEIALEGGG